MTTQPTQTVRAVWPIASIHHTAELELAWYHDDENGRQTINTVRYKTAALTIVAGALLFSGIIFTETPYNRVGAAPAGTVHTQGMSLSAGPTNPAQGQLLVPTVTVRAVRVIDLLRTPRSQLEWSVSGTVNADARTATLAATALADAEGLPAELQVLFVTTSRGELRAGDIIREPQSSLNSNTIVPSIWVGHAIHVVREGFNFELIVGKGEVGTALERREVPLDPSVQVRGAAGASSGLAVALAVYDARSPGTLTNSRKVAATGTVAADGTVGAVIGVSAKAWSAAAAGASIFIVPSGYGERARRSGAPVEVVEVSTLAEAVAALNK